MKSVNPKTRNALLSYSVKIVVACTLAASLLLPAFSSQAGTAPELLSVGGDSALAPEAAQSEAVYNIDIDQDGIYQVTYEALLAAGLDLDGVSLDDIALTNQGAPAPIEVSAPGATFGPGADILFFGQALESVYSHTNVYQLQVENSLASRIAQDGGEAPAGTPPAHYIETILVDNNRAYNYMSPNEDPWYDTQFLVYSTPKTWDQAFSVDHYLPGAATAHLSVETYGVTDFYQSPDHHLQIAFNSQTVSDVTFDGAVIYTLEADLAPEDLLEGENTISFTLVGDTGTSWDMVHLDRYSVSYPRAFVARDGWLTFTGQASLFQVTGLPSDSINVFRIEAGAPVRLTGTQVAGSTGAYSVTFAGQSAAQATFCVFSQDSYLTPVDISPARSQVDITGGSADYIMISHPDFIANLAPLIAVREAQGFVVKVVDVFDIYVQFSHGVFGPQAIKDYIAHAKDNMGASYVLLVGGDTYDYFDYLGLGSVSYIPTLYTATDDQARFVPVDPMFADVDGDNLPDLALGRFPVRSTAELDALVAKTLAYEEKDYGATALFSADQWFGVYTDPFVESMPAEWDSQKAYIDDLGTAGARAEVLDALDTGTALVSYFGHSGETKWTSNGSLLKTDDTYDLANQGRPAVVTQYGCWNTYFVDPDYDGLAHGFLLSGDKGAAAVLGSTTLNYVHSQMEYGELLFPRLTTEGATIGQAMLEAKGEMDAIGHGYIEILLGFTLLGDPALDINAEGEGPTSVTLDGFAVSPAPEIVVIDWQTAVEIDTLGFNLYRAGALDESRARLNASLIPAEAFGGVGGASYEFIDAAARPGKNYYYWLEVVSVDGVQTFGPAQAASLYGVYLPTVVRN